EWGSFRFHVYYAIGGIATFAAAMGYGETLTSFPLYASLFLAFAAIFPDYELLLFFILPVKVKYMAMLTWLVMVWNFWAGSGATRAGLLASLTNYLLFFGPGHFQKCRLWWEVRRNRRRMGPDR